MKSAADGDVQPNAIIIEAPFGSMQQTVKNRFAQMGLPSFPMAHLLVLWGGLQHGFWAFSHNPADYAKQVNCPLMLIYGAQDDRVTLEEIEAIQNNLKGESKLAIYPNAGHVNFLEEYRNQWTNDVLAFAGKWMRST
jgi:pimeloyl-ACP methyl ester carboxylesterase